MFQLNLDIYTIFLDRLFIKDNIISTNLIKDVYLHFENSIKIYINVKENNFYEVFNINGIPRNELFKPEIIIIFNDNTEKIIKNATDNYLIKETYWQYVNPIIEELKQKQNGRVLEIGSRARSGISRKNQFKPNMNWEYVGFDIYNGENVDVIGDGHCISSYFPNEHFDFVVSIAVLEHIMIPWKLSIELNKIMKVGSIGIFITHQTYPVHDMPWDFWRFSDKSWDAIFNKYTGFQILNTKMLEPAYIVSKVIHQALDHQDYMGYQCSLVIFKKIGNTDLSWNVNINDIILSQYPTT